MSLRNTLYIILLIFLSNCSNYRNIVSNCTSLKFEAITDFEKSKVKNFKPAYHDKRKKALALDAGKFKGEFAAAAVKFKGSTGAYNIKINTLAELDGESKYRIAINRQRLKKTFKNPRIFGKGKRDYTPASYTWKKVSLKKGDEIRVEFSSETNGKIPEGNTTAYSRGRWTSLEIGCIK